VDCFLFFIFYYELVNDTTKNIKQRAYAQSSCYYVRYAFVDAQHDRN
jgi:hypothetical protein